MKITNASITKITELVTGDAKGVWKYRKGRDLVQLFNGVGFRDDDYNGNLPKLNNSGLNTSRGNYTKDRLAKSTNEQIILIIKQIVKDSTNKDSAIEEINTILKADNIKIEQRDGELRFEGISIDEATKLFTSFNKCESDVIHVLDNAKVSILIAMAWFTNEKIKNILEKKRKEGLRIEIVIHEDGINNKYGVDLSKFDCKKNRSERGGIMHNKFCVIDNQNVITGSYNWTNNAEYKNEENVLITENNATATEYSIKIRKLKPLTDEVKDVNNLKISANE